MKNISESLAGSMGSLHFERLSYGERDGLPDCPPFLSTSENIEIYAAKAPKADFMFIFHQI